MKRPLITLSDDDGGMTRAYVKLCKAAKRHNAQRAKKRRLLPASNGWPEMHVSKWYMVEKKWQKKFADHAYRYVICASGITV